MCPPCSPVRSYLVCALRVCPNSGIPLGRTSTPAAVVYSFARHISRAYVSCSFPAPFLISAVLHCMSIVVSLGFYTGSGAAQFAYWGGLFYFILSVALYLFSAYLVSASHLVSLFPDISCRLFHPFRVWSMLCPDVGVYLLFLGRLETREAARGSSPCFFLRRVQASLHSSKSLVF